MHGLQLIAYCTATHTPIGGNPISEDTTSAILENVEHCGGEPEQADTACLLPN